MKKIFIPLSIIAIPFLSSCKKDYTCTCVYSYSDGSQGYTQIDNITKAKKSDARANCLSYSETSTDNPGVTTNVSCNLK